MTSKARSELIGYLIVLRVIQPARIQDIERHAPSILPERTIELYAETAFRRAHSEAKRKDLIMSVRRGSYHLTKHGMNMITALGLDEELDNRRLFLMKEQHVWFTK